ncbi:MAG: PEP/pyruvate-binding domain-containing protein [Vulcanimicrobiaceae bacterium]
MLEPDALPATYSILPGASLPNEGATEVGNKAWNLMRMLGADLPVPSGFVLSTGWCRRLREGHADEAALRQTLQSGIARLEAASDLRFGSPRRPLLVSVRSGAAVSMPGMLETVLDVGLNLESVAGLIRMTGNPRLAWDSFRRLIQGYAEVVAELPTEPFDSLVQQALADAEASDEDELDHRRLRTLTAALLERYHALRGEPFPTDPLEQLLAAARAVFRSWDAPKAATYRRLNEIRDDAGTAVTVQTMVYGNAGGASGAGVGFTRNPATGERELYLDFRFNGQGEDIVAGRRMPSDTERLRRVLPAVWQRLEDAGRSLEILFGDAQDFEFTVQDGRLFLLQTRAAKRTPWAALRIAADMVEEGLLSPAEALSQLGGIELEALVRTRFAPPLPHPLARASVAGVGVASGAIALDAGAVERLTETAGSVVLVRTETAASDVAGIAKAQGLLTARGARTSHAAVVARQLGKVCLVACPDVTIDLERRLCTIGGRTFAEGDPLSLDGNDGAIYPGILQTTTERPERELAAVARWRSATRCSMTESTYHGDPR